MFYEYPLFLILLIFIPLFVIWEFQVWQVGQTGLHPLFVRYMTRKPWEIWILIAMKSFILSLCIILLARPVAREVTSQQVRNGIDIQIVLDISRSMLAEDIPPNRMSVAKNTIVQFLDQQNVDRVWIVIFAGKPFTTAPLSFDSSILTQLLTPVSVDMILQSIPWLAGTAIGDALLIAGDNFSSGSTEWEREKLIIILTDGRANIGISPIIAAKLLREKNIRTFVIGIGSASGTLLYTTNALGKREYFRDENGEPIRADLDEPMMREIARLTGGKYWNSSGAETLSEIFLEIRRLTKKPILYERVEYRVPLDTYFFMILLAWLSVTILFEIWVVWKWKIPKK